ncbi:unnamed protein product, partial [Brassica oleracea]
MKHYISKSHLRPKHPTQYKFLDKYLAKNYCADYRSHGNCSLSLRYRLMNETSTVQQKNIFPNQV